MESQRHVLWNILPNIAFSLPPYLGLSDESCSPCAVLTEREFRLGAGGLFPRLCLTGPGWTLETPRPLRPEAQALLPQLPSPASAARSPTDPRKHRGSSSGLSEDRGTWLLPSPSVCQRENSQQARLPPALSRCLRSSWNGGWGPCPLSHSVCPFRMLSSLVPALLCPTGSSRPETPQRPASRAAWGGFSPSLSWAVSPSPAEQEQVGWTEPVLPARGLCPGFLCPFRRVAPRRPVKSAFQPLGGEG